MHKIIGILHYGVTFEQNHSFCERKFLRKQFLVGVAVNCVTEARYFTHLVIEKKVKTKILCLHFQIIH